MRDATEITSAYLRRRRRVRWAVGAALFLTLLLIVADHLRVFARWGGYAGNDHQLFDGKPFVIRAAEGQTLLAAPEGGGEAVRVRLIGLELVWAERLRDHIGQRVIVRLEPLRTRDSTGLLLCYLYLDEDRMLNLDLLRDGQAKATQEPHAFSSQFAQAQATARRKRLGCWSASP